MSLFEIVEVRFRKGENKRFLNARKAARNAGYPDVPAYLRATGQVDEWCEEISQQEFEECETAQRLRHSLQVLQERRAYARSTESQAG